MINKNLILTFFIIILAIALLKNREQFEDQSTGLINGCRISNPADVNPNEIYNCMINQVNSITGEFNKLNEKDASQQYRLIKQIGTQMKNYFIMLYMNNLEKYYKGIIVVAVAPYMTRKTPTSVTKIETPDIRHFIKGTHEKNDTYELIKPLRLFTKSGIRTIHQIGYVIVPLGFNIGLSQPDNNPLGNKCTGRIRQNNSGNGPCIPAHIGYRNSYLQGGKVYDIRNLINHYVNTGGKTTVWRRQPLWMNERSGTFWPRGGGNRGSYQKHFNWHTAVDDTMRSCWLGTDKPASVCNYSYGNSMFKHINVLPNENFFNTFYATKSKREEIRNQFRLGNFNSLKGFF